MIIGKNVFMQEIRVDGHSLGMKNDHEIPPRKDEDQMWEGFKKPHSKEDLVRGGKGGRIPCT